MDFDNIISADDIRTKGTFVAKLRNEPVKIDGLFPSSMDRTARTDIAIALIKSGLVKYDNGWGVPLRVQHPFIIYNHLYSPDLDEKVVGGHTKGGNSIKLTWVDWDRVERETQ